MTGCSVRINIVTGDTVYEHVHGPDGHCHLVEVAEWLAEPEQVRYFGAEQHVEREAGK